MVLEKLKSFNPVTPSLRGTVLLKTATSKKNKPFKALTVGKGSTGGRNHHGRITVRFRGGGHKRRYRIISFQRSLLGGQSKVMSLEYDPNRTAAIALLKRESDGVHEYVVASSSMQVGDVVSCSDKADVLPGNVMPLANIPVGTSVYCVELKPGAGARIARSAGTSVVLIGKDQGKAIIKLPSGETRYVSSACLATVGVVSNTLHRNIKEGKAGRRRWKGFRPHVRGVAMNPVDHPLGGGEGKTSGGRHPVSPWGLVKGKKTRNNKRTEAFIISRPTRKKK